MLPLGPSRARNSSSMALIALWIPPRLLWPASLPLPLAWPFWDSHLHLCPSGGKLGTEGHSLGQPVGSEVDFTPARFAQSARVTPCSSQCGLTPELARSASRPGRAVHSEARGPDRPSLRPHAASGQASHAPSRLVRICACCFSAFHPEGSRPWGGAAPLTGSRNAGKSEAATAGGHWGTCCPLGFLGRWDCGCYIGCRLLQFLLLMREKLMIFAKK